MNVGQAHSECNPNSSWLSDRGGWAAYTAGVMVLHLLLRVVLCTPWQFVWTATNVIHNLLMYVIMHMVKGAPWLNMDQGESRRLTYWEQIDSGAQFTDTKKFLTIFPIGLAQARESSDIFTARSDIQLTPRKVKNYQQSRIFGSAEIERKVIMKKSPSSAVNTQDRLFGTPEPSPQRRGRVSDTYRSSIFNASTEFETNSNKSSTENSKLNNSALENGSENGDAKTETDGKNAPAGNGPDAASEDGAAGKEMKSGAESNGEIVGNDTNNNVKNNTPTMQRIRQPPGGFSSGLW